MSTQFRQLDDPSPPSDLDARFEEVRRRAGRRTWLLRGSVALIAGVSCALIAFATLGEPDQGDVVETRSAPSEPGVAVAIIDQHESENHVTTIRFRTANGTSIDRHFGPQVTIERETSTSDWRPAFVCGALSDVDGAGGECEPGDAGLLETVSRHSPPHGYGPVETVSVSLPPGRYRLARVVLDEGEPKTATVQDVATSAVFEVD